VDNNGTYLDFTGTFEDGKMTLVRDAIVRGEKCKQRMVWYDIEEGQFHWNWDAPTTATDGVFPADLTHAMTSLRETSRRARRSKPQEAIRDR
jgi:hypothetical protein